MVYNGSITKGKKPKGEQKKVGERLDKPPPKPKGKSPKVIGNNIIQF